MVDGETSSRGQVPNRHLYPSNPCPVAMAKRQNRTASHWKPSPFQRASSLFAWLQRTRSCSGQWSIPTCPYPLFRAAAAVGCGPMLSSRVWLSVVSSASLCTGYDQSCVSLRRTDEVVPTPDGGPLGTTWELLGALDSSTSGTSGTFWMKLPHVMLDRRSWKTPPSLFHSAPRFPTPPRC